MAKTFVVCDQCNQMNRVELNTHKEAVCGSCKHKLPLSDSIVEGGDKNLEKLISKSPIPVVVDVWAQWCGPCRAFAPTFKTASDKFADKAVFVKLDSEKNQYSSGKLNVRSIPTILVFKDGKELARQSGALSSHHLEEWLQKLIVR